MNERKNGFRSGSRNKKSYEKQVILSISTTKPLRQFVLHRDEGKNHRLRSSINKKINLSKDRLMVKLGQRKGKTHFPFLAVK